MRVRAEVGYREGSSLYLPFLLKRMNPYVFLLVGWSSFLKIPKRTGSYTSMLLLEECSYCLSFVQHNTIIGSFSSLLARFYVAMTSRFQCMFYLEGPYQDVSNLNTIYTRFI